MRLFNLVEESNQPEAGDIIGFEFGDILIESRVVEHLDDGIVVELNEEGQEYLTELLPLIPVAIWAGGAAWTAYDTWKAKKQYDAGEITGAEFATRVGTDAAIGIAGGVVAKGALKGAKFAWKAGKKIFAKGADDAVDATTDAAKALAKKAEVPKVDLTAKIKTDAPVKVTTPKVDAKVVTPKVDVPKVDAKVVTPKVTTPKVDTKVVTPKVDVPKVDAKVVTPKVDTKVTKLKTKVTKPRVATDTPNIKTPKVVPTPKLKVVPSDPIAKTQALRTIVKTKVKPTKVKPKLDGPKVVPIPKVKVPVAKVPVAKVPVAKVVPTPKVKVKPTKVTVKPDAPNIKTPKVVPVPKVKVKTTTPKVKPKTKTKVTPTKVKTKLKTKKKGKFKGKGRFSSLSNNGSDGVDSNFQSFITKHGNFESVEAPSMELISEAEYQGRQVKLNKPMQGDVKKSKVYVKDPKTGNVKKVNFGHGGSSAKASGEKTMSIKKSNPERRKSFRARHNCDSPGPKTKARYWSCKAW